MKIIDVHAHLSERKDDALNPLAKTNGLAYTLNELLGIMRKNKVDHGLLLSPPLNGTACLPNRAIIKLCEKSRKMLSPVITVDPTSKEVKEALELAEQNKGKVKAFKIRLGYVKASGESRLFDRLYKYAESEGLPVLFHTGDTVFSDGDLARAHPLTLDGLANRRKDLRIVLCHFGNPWFDDVAELIYKHPNVYTDTSGLITGEGAYHAKYADWLARKISEAIYFAGGSEKILFGTDYPVSKHSEAIDLIKKLDVDEGEKQKILSGNAGRLFCL